MKPTLNEEIGMSQEGIDYVNSLEVKEPVFSCDADCPDVNYGNCCHPSNCVKTPFFNVSEDVAMKALHNNIPEEIERQRIKRQGRNALICVLIIIALTFITNYFNK